MDAPPLPFDVELVCKLIIAARDSIVTVEKRTHRQSRREQAAAHGECFEHVQEALSKLGWLETFKSIYRRADIRKGVTSNHNETSCVTHDKVVCSPSRRDFVLADVSVRSPGKLTTCF